MTNNENGKLGGDGWVSINEHDIPQGIRFHVINPGHTVERAYGDRGRSEPGQDAPYKRVHDHAEGAPRYYVRAKLSPVWQAGEKQRALEEAGRVAQEGEDDRY